MINIEITFFTNCGEVDIIETKDYEDIDSFMYDYGFEYFRINKSEKYYNDCKERFLSGETLRWDDQGLKFDPQWNSVDDTIMKIKINK